MLWFTKSRRAQSVDDYETWIAGGVMPTLNAFDNGDVRTTIMVIPIHDKATRFNGKRKLANGEYSMDGAGNGLGIGEDGAPMNTLTGADRHAVGTEQTVRRLTPVEAERLQGFPDDWTDGQADSHRYKQMGNAVTVNVARWIGERL